jgi:hypothetical protein
MKNRVNIARSSVAQGGGSLDRAALNHCKWKKKFVGKNVPKNKN